MPKFLAEESENEHFVDFANTTGIVFYYTKVPQRRERYSERHAWLTNTFDAHLHEVAIYHKTRRKWIFLQALLGSRNPITNVMQSSLVRRYIAHCGPDNDNYRLILSLTRDLMEPVEIRLADFRVDMEIEEFHSVKESYQRDILLLRLYAIQEYGQLVRSEELMWISDELNGAFLSSWSEYESAVRGLVPVVQKLITDHAQEAGVFFSERRRAADELDLG